MFLFTIKKLPIFITNLFPFIQKMLLIGTSGKRLYEFKVETRHSKRENWKAPQLSLMQKYLMLTAN